MAEPLTNAERNRAKRDQRKRQLHRLRINEVRRRSERDRARRDRRNLAQWIEENVEGAQVVCEKSGQWYVVT